MTFLPDEWSETERGHPDRFTVFHAHILRVKVFFNNSARCITRAMSVGFEFLLYIYYTAWSHYVQLVVCARARAILIVVTPRIFRVSLICGVFVRAHVHLMRTILRMA